jgi:hypothetical protein
MRSSLSIYGSRRFIWTAEPNLNPEAIQSVPAAEETWFLSPSSDATTTWLRSVAGFPLDIAIVNLSFLLLFHQQTPSFRSNSGRDWVTNTAAISDAPNRSCHIARRCGDDPVSAG